MLVPFTAAAWFIFGGTTAAAALVRAQEAIRDAAKEAVEAGTLVDLGDGRFQPAEKKA